MRPLFVMLIAAVMLAQMMPAAGGSGDRDGPSCDGPPLPDVPTPGDDAAGTMGLPSSSGGFTQNVGQLPNDDIRFYSQGGGVWFTDDGVWYDIGNPDADGGVTLKQEFVGANAATAQGRGVSGHLSHFFLGSDPSLWRSDVPTFDEVWYPGLWDGVDLRYYDSGRGLKYDLIVSPGGAVEDIALRYAGADGITVAGGELLVHTAAGAFTDGGLYIYQETGGGRQDIAGRFVSMGGCEYGFEITGAYDPDLPLVIDPALQYSTYIGAEADDWGHDLVVDSQGYIYLTGMTSSVNFPATPGAYNTSLYENYDTFVALLEPGAKDIVYCTYFGGEDDDKPWGIDIDGNDNVFVAGNTESRQLPTTPGAHDTSYNGGNSDAFAMMLSYDGSDLMYSTFIGGSLGDYGLDVKLGSLGEAYITGFTYSSNMPVTGGAFDTTYSGGGEGFVLKLSSTGDSLGYCTYLGEGGGDIGYSLAVDGSDLVSVCGRTTSPTFPTTAGAYRTSYDSNGANIFVSRLNSDGSDLLYSTFVGVGSACSNGLAVDGVGDIFIAGNTDSGDFPGAEYVLPHELYGPDDDPPEGGGQDIFLAKIHPSGDGEADLVFSSITGGAEDEGVYGMDIGPCGEVHVTGYTASTDFPVSLHPCQGELRGGEDCFRVIFDPGGGFLWSSEYIGGSLGDIGWGVAVDNEGDSHIVGQTYSDDMPVTAGAFDGSYNNQTDVFVLSLQASTGVTGVELMKDGEPVETAYSKLGPYTYRVTVANPYGENDVADVYLNLNDTTNPVGIEWDRTSDKFTKKDGPGDLITKEDSSASYDKDLRTWTLLFNFTFDWDFPFTDLQYALAYLNNTLLIDTESSVTRPSTLVRDLELDGTLTLTGEDGRSLSDGDHVGGGESVTVSGLRAVYKDTTNVFPPPDEYDIMVTDDSGGVWITSPGEGEYFSLGLTAPTTNIAGLNEYTVSISGIPEERDVSDVSFSLRVDADGVEFSDHIPNGTGWHTDSNVTLGVTIADTGGSRVNGTSIQVSISPDDGATWGSWRNVTYDDARTVAAKTIQELPDGSDVMVRWRAGDTLGNGPDVSPSHRLMVDTADVEFSGPFVDDSVGEFLILTVNVTDATSGVNSSAVEYSHSSDGGMTWSEWWEPGLGDIQSGISTFRGPAESATVTFWVERWAGDGWRLRLRAMDVAGNGPARSPAYVHPSGPEDAP